MKTAKLDANDLASEHGLGVAREVTEQLAQAAANEGLLSPITPHDYRDGYRLPSELLALDTTVNPNRLLGNDWLCRGGGAVLAAYSGKGKSTLAMQAAVLWSSGLDLFGLVPAFPLRVLMIQAENDGQDQARTLKGIVNSLQIPIKDLDKNLYLFLERSSTGTEFLARLRGIVGALEPDLVIIDPLLSYLGGSASDQQVVSAFLRNGLNPISAAYGCAWLLVHHCAKPPKDPAIRQALADISDYLDLGSVEFTNWPRSKLFLREIDAEERRYALLAGKRGHDAGFRDAEGKETREVFIRHARGGNICWERDDTPIQGASESVVSAVAVGLEEFRRLVSSGEMPSPADTDLIRRTCSRVLGRTYHAECFSPSRQDRPERRLYEKLSDIVGPLHGKWDLSRLVPASAPSLPETHLTEVDKP